MPRPGHFNFCFPAALRTLAEQRAATAGISLSDFVRAAIAARVGAPDLAAVPMGRPPVNPPLPDSGRTDAPRAGVRQTRRPAAASRRRSPARRARSG